MPGGEEGRDIAATATVTTKATSRAALFPCCTNPDKSSNMIRKLQPSDMEDVLDIWLEASIKAHDFIDRGFWESKVAEMRDIYLPTGATYVFVEDGIVSGFLTLCDNTVAALFVSPSQQGKGIGTKLLGKACEIRSDLDLAVYKENIGSVGFYKRFGFVVIGERICEHTGHAEMLMVFDSSSEQTGH